jgi:hypothetical protein
MGIQHSNIAKNEESGHREPSLKGIKPELVDFLI